LNGENSLNEKLESNLNKIGVGSLQ
jgi:hypothetical protein